MKININGNIDKHDLNFKCLEAIRRKTYSENHLNEFCKKHDEKDLFYKITINENELPELRLSKKAWETKQGHYPVLFKAIHSIIDTYDFSGVKGSFIIWLNDAVWKDAIKNSMQVPILTFSREKNDNYSFLIPDPAYLGSDGYIGDRKTINQWEVELSNLKKETIFWRGVATGIGIETKDWKKTARCRLVLKAKELGNKNLLDAKITKYKHLDNAQIKIFEELGILGEVCEFRDFLSYKYLIDVDGYAAAWMSFFLKLASKSLVLKIESDYEQWFYNKVTPWKHYIPLLKDLSDIEDIYDWLVNNDKKVTELVAEANQIIKEITIDRDYYNLAILFKEIISCQRKNG